MTWSALHRPPCDPPFAAIGREAHGQPTLLVDVPLDETGGLDLLEDGVELGVVAHAEDGSRRRFTRPYLGVDIGPVRAAAHRAGWHWRSSPTSGSLPTGGLRCVRCGRVSE